MRHPLALLDHKDSVLASKALLMKDRLEAFCPDMNVAFWYV